MHISRVRIRHEVFPTTEQYPLCLDIFNKTDYIDFPRPVTFFIGENGTGKTTLLKAIARHCDIHIWEDGSRVRYHFNKFEDALSRYIDVEWAGERVPGSFFSSEIFRHFTGILDEWARADPGALRYFGNTSLVEKSHGQSHMTFFENRFSIKGLFLLDEPETALSPRMQIELLKLFGKAISGGEAQFIIATHSPILLAYPGAVIHSFDKTPISRVAYEETDYFRVYHDFLNNREKYLDGI